MASNCRDLDSTRLVSSAFDHFKYEGNKIIIKTRYSDNELGELRELITDKIRVAREEFLSLAGSLNSANSNGTDDTAAAGKTLEDGSDSLEKESINQLASRQKKFIEQLEAALIRIQNKTYGICRETGKLIPKERLRAVPHTTLSMEAKMKQH
ncbi:TraR/DksA family transcriptional regulator [Mucilaginibacter gilvus]|uniref:TraR/DksA family transcriptional regulator n=1 Tax=Mucilaginibacter gilvus TaxID=2305909 RepID=A0A444MQH6_9SPHI|nr:TraR/DksA C4-type zinc finger protein [Mucilaginibacter gilvus]RWY53862.1 TraR/DksA family transcriptional regulator [Mucilaginibacter gilvus]